MPQEEWQDLDELTSSTIMLKLSKSIYFNVKDKTSKVMIYGTNYVTYMTKAECSFSCLLVETIG